MILSSLKKKLLDNHEYLIEQFLIEQEKQMPPFSDVLDAGAGQCQYKHIFTRLNHYVAQDACIGDDRWDYSQINIKSPIEKIPVKKESFDYIICTQVLEHVPSPDKVFKEFARILRPNGKLLLTAPQCVGEHQVPYNFFNFIRYGLKKLAEDNGFKVISIEPQGGYPMLIGQMLQTLPYYVFGENRVTKVLFYPYRLLVTSIGFCLDYFDKRRTTTFGYMCVFQKVKR